MQRRFPRLTEPDFTRPAWRDGGRDRAAYLRCAAAWGWFGPAKPTIRTGAMRMVERSSPSLAGFQMPGIGCKRPQASSLRGAQRRGNPGWWGVESIVRPDRRGRRGPQGYAEAAGRPASRRAGSDGQRILMSIVSPEFSIVSPEFLCPRNSCVPGIPVVSPEFPRSAYSAARGLFAVTICAGVAKATLPSGVTKRARSWRASFNSRSYWSSTTTSSIVHPFTSV